jgi:PEP-CTERM motif
MPFRRAAPKEGALYGSPSSLQESLSRHPRRLSVNFTLPAGRLGEVLDFPYVAEWHMYCLKILVIKRGKGQMSHNKTAKLASITAAGVVACLLGASAAQAGIITDEFTFYDASNNAIATGSFSYNSADSGTLSFADLSSFSVTLGGSTYNLAFVDSATDYVYFDFDTASKTFVAGTADGFQGTFETMLSAANSNGTSGFFFDPLATMNVPNNDGIACSYDPSCTSPYYLYAVSYQISQVPEPASLALLGSGLVAAGFAFGRRKSKSVRQA